MFYAPGGGSLSLDDLASYGFDTSDGAEFEVCSITKEEAIKMFEKYLTTHDPCVWAKHNAPFMCTKQGPPAPSAVFSLAYVIERKNNIFSVLSFIYDLGYFLFAGEKGTRERKRKHIC